MVFALGFPVLVSMVLTTAVQVMSANVPSLVPAWGNAITMARYVVAVALPYRFLPDRSVRWPQAFIGSFITAPRCMLGRWGIGIYFSQATPGSVHGSFRALLILLEWIYCAAMVFFIGASITAVVDGRLRGLEHPPDPTAYANVIKRSLCR